MKLQVIKIHNHGNHLEEFVEMKVIADCDLSHFLLTDNTYAADGTISNKLRHPYWFLPKKVLAGDLVFLYTRRGADTSWRNRAGSTTHERFWDLREPVWNDTGDCAVLFELAQWRTIRAGSPVSRLTELLARLDNI
jgi:hypothetical protein